MPADPRAMGWPFLVAAGRVRDHSVIVAPDFLVASSEYGVLEQVDGSASIIDEPNRTAVGTPSGRHLAVAYQMQVLIPEDVAVPGSRTPAAATDEHNRPLRLLVGIVTAQPLRDDPRPDLDQAWARVLPVYRMFLRDEQRFAVASSGPMPLASRTVAPAPVAHHDPVPPRPRTAESHAAAGPPPAAAAFPMRQLAAVAVVLVIALSALMWHPWTGSSNAPRGCSSDATATATTTAPQQPGASTTGCS